MPIRRGKHSHIHLVSRMMIYLQESSIEDQDLISFLEVLGMELAFHF